MKRVMQRSDDDCFAACLASLLEVPLADVPNYGRSSQHRQMLLTRTWLRRTHGLAYMGISVRRHVSITGAPLLGVLTVEVPGCDYLHAVVAEYRSGKIKVVHDPAPQPSRYGKRALFGWLM